MLINRFEPLTLLAPLWTRSTCPSATLADVLTEPPLCQVLQHAIVVGVRYEKVAAAIDGDTSCRKATGLASVKERRSALSGGDGKVRVHA